MKEARAAERFAQKAKVADEGYLNYITPRLFAYRTGV
jgi:hypothetical protein